MGAVGTRVDECGTLLREKGGFVLRRDVGGRWKLNLHRVPVDNVGERASISGVVVTSNQQRKRVRQGANN